MLLFLNRIVANGPRHHEPLRSNWQRFARLALPLPPFQSTARLDQNYYNTLAFKLQFSLVFPAAGLENRPPSRRQNAH